MVWVQSISLRPQFNNFSRDTVTLSKNCAGRLFSENLTLSNVLYQYLVCEIVLFVKTCVVYYCKCRVVGDLLPVVFSRT